MNLLKDIPKAFFGFLIASAFIWMLINFSKTYTSEVKYGVNYINLAQDKIFKEKPPEEISLQLSGTGFKLLTANFSDKKIDLDLSKLQKKKTETYFFHNKNLGSVIQKQIGSGLTLKQVQPDSIYVSLGTLTSKKVPLKPNLNLTFQLGYDLAKPAIITPDSVLISGAKEELKSINQLELAPLIINNISESLSKKVNIINLNNESVKVDAKTAEVNLEIDKFTEGEIKVPILIKNIPKGIKLNIFPKKASVTYKVGLSNFNKINSNSFEVICDYNYALNEGVNFLIPELINHPKAVSSIKISPSKIDFLVTE